MQQYPDMILVLGAIVFFVGLGLGALIFRPLGADSTRRRIKKRGLVAIASQGDPCIVVVGEKRIPATLCYLDNKQRNMVVDVTSDLLPADLGGNRLWYGAIFEIFGWQHPALVKRREKESEDRSLVVHFQY